MPAETLFQLANLAALIGWAALALLAPFRRATAITVARWVCALLAGLYVALIARGLIAGPGLPQGAGFTTLAAVTLLFSTQGGVLGGWVHYLAFDLFVGSVLAEDAPAANIPHWLLLPCLALTFVSGPAGLLLYLFLRAVRKSRGSPRNA